MAMDIIMGKIQHIKQT